MTDKEIPKDYDQSMEEELQDLWQKENTYRFIGDGTKPTYIIDTPPPYPTGKLHMGHVLNWVYMDIIARYKRMNDYDVLFPQGWDCHGLPTEVKVEEIHGIKKNDVSREKFREYCIDLTHDNIEKMRKQMLSMGYSQDWSHEYITMLPENKYRTQLSFLELYDKDMIYQDIHPINWCPRCETAIAFAEVEYKDNTTKLNYVNFPATEGDGYVTIATTRPELLCACVAVVVHPDDERYTNLHGKTVTLPIYEREVKIITDDSVDPEYGTGVVMICTFGDKTDVEWVTRYNLDVIDAISEDGHMLDVAGKYSGMEIKECRKTIIDDLKSEGYLTKQEDVDQNVGLCWRCKTPIEIMTKKQWFVAVKQMTDDIIKQASSMRWIPDHMYIRLENWANSMDWDWCISRQRIFATPIPVWYCDECHEVVLPSKEQLPVDPTIDQPDHACNCGCTSFTAEEDVLDTWMDSSITPLTVADWPNPGWENVYPSTLRPQGHDIIRTWAFYTILRCYALTGEKPFDELVINGMVFGEDGHKMSKSLGNVIAPEEVITEYGADALRLWSANSVPGSDVPFAWKDIKHAYKFLRKFWNAFRFINMNLDDDVADSLSGDNIIDKWILSKLNRLNKTVTEAYEKYNFAKAEQAIYNFVWHDFCDEYIEAVKYRLYDEVDSTADAKYVLKNVIETVLKLMAPITPFFADLVNGYLGNDSTQLHIGGWPEVDEKLIDDEAEQVGDYAIDIIDELRRYKSSHGIPLNQLLSTVNIYSEEVIVIKKSIDDIKNTNKVDNITVQNGKPDLHEKVTKVEPVMSKIGPVFKQDAKKIIDCIASTEPEEIVNILEENGEVQVDNVAFTSEHITTESELVSKTGEVVDILKTEEYQVLLEVQQ
ncbi:MAG: valine--tRNA ligase [Methanosphaera sp.]|nr:valine--tRNA ligase [Methanosphaera sp.]